MVKNKLAQMKIQQMAFMIVAVVVFFAMVAVIYFSISLRGLETKVQELRDDEAREIARQLASSPEFAFTASSDCEDCIDLERAFQISQNPNYQNSFWNLNYLALERISPPSSENISCTNLQSYIARTCNQIVIFKDESYATKTAFVSLAIWDPTIGVSGDYRYQLGRIHVSAPPIEDG